jgi:hypothetical protein
VQPPPGKSPPATNAQLTRAQDHALLDGPFPAGGLVRGVSDGALFLAPEESIRGLALAKARAAGASVVRIQLNWASLVAAAASTTFTPSPGTAAATVAPAPPSAEQRNPASPMYDFSTIDAAVRSAVEAGLQPLLVVTHAPVFAEAPDRWRYAYPGSWAPDPAALGAFAVALASRYDGSFPDPLAPGRALPRVTLYQAWNEPNLARYLEPQWVAVGAHWRAFSPLIYRQMLSAFYGGIKSVDPHDVALAAGVAPNGDPAGIGRMAPVTFLRGLLCLQSRARCTDPPHFDVLAFHPLSVGDPDHPAAASLDVSISDAAKVTGLLLAAERRHTVLPAGKKAVWVTELNWESAPAAARGVPLRLQAAWISRALHRLWVAGVGLVDWQFLLDPYPALRLGDPTGGGVDIARPAGLYSPGPGSGLLGVLQSASPKPFLQGFSFPFDPLRTDRGHVRVWSLLMRPAAPVLLQRLTAGHHGWRTLARLRADGHGVLNALVALKGAAVLRLQSGRLLSGFVRVPR